LRPGVGAIFSRGRFCARVASLPTPSPCDRPYRLGLLWVGLTPSRSRLRLPLVGSRRPADIAGMAARSPVFVAPSFYLMASRVRLLRFSPTVPRSYSTPADSSRACHCARDDAAFPVTLAGRHPHFDLLRSCINLEGTATSPAAWLVPCVRFTNAVPPSVHHLGFGQYVGNAVAPAISNGLANISATLGSNYWLGFITTGLSPDKKRHALHGAQL
jgi:hypothetical protein